MRDVPFVVSVLQFSSLPKRWRDGSLSGARSPTVLLCVLQLLCGFSDAPFLTGLPCTPSRATQMCGSVPQAPFCTEGSRESGLPSCAPFSIPGVCCPGPDPPSGHEGVGRVAGVPHTDATFSGSLCPRPPPPPPACVASPSPGPPSHAVEAATLGRSAGAWLLRAAAGEGRAGPGEEGGREAGPAWRCRDAARAHGGVGSSLSAETVRRRLLRARPPPPLPASRRYAEAASRQPQRSPPRPRLTWGGDPGPPGGTGSV